MSKKKKELSNSEIEKKETVTDNKEEKVSNDPYKTNGFLDKIPYWVKAIFIKYWFFGAVCFFVGMGLSLSGVFYALVGGLICGALTDVATDNILLMMDSDLNESRNFLLYKTKSVWSLLINIVYSIGLFFAGAFFCDWIVDIIYRPDNWFLSSFLAEPLSQGLVFIIFDMAIIGIKDLIVYLVKSNKKEKKEI